MALTVGVVMCVHNAWPFLPEAVESVLGQQHPVDRFVIVDDASDDACVAYLDGLADPRLLMLRNPARMGPGVAGQRGVEACGCDLIARLDADDVAEPWRIGAQVAHMAGDPGLAMTCMSVRLIDDSGSDIGHYDVPRDSAGLQWELLFGNPVVHSTVMLSVRALEEAEGYAALEVAEDYDLWSRLARSGARMEPIPRAGVKLRKHEGQVSELRRDQMLDEAVRIASANIEWLTGEPPDLLMVRMLGGGIVEQGLDVGPAIELLARVTRTYLDRNAPGFVARRRVSARCLERAWSVLWAAGSARKASTRALRSCVATMGYAGLTTARGVRVALRVAVPDWLTAVRRRVRSGGAG